MPTQTQFQELKDECTWTWTTRNGKEGYEVKGKNGNSIFLPAAGFRSGMSLYYDVSCGYYWSSSLSTDRPNGGRSLDFCSGSVFSDHWDYRYAGFSVRPGAVQIITFFRTETEKPNPPCRDVACCVPTPMSIADLYITASKILFPSCSIHSGCSWITLFFRNENVIRL